MTNSKQTKSALFSSVVALLLCFTMLLGTTFAWFTDNVSTSGNTIQAGTLDVQLLDASGNSLEDKSLVWQKAEGHENEAVLWEPGCTYNLQPITIKNNGNLALKYKIEITGIQGDAKLNEVIEWTITNSNSEKDLSADHSLAAGAFDTLTISGHMKEEAGNEYQGLSIDGVVISVLATQDTVEYDSTNNQYDKNAEYSDDNADDEATGDIVTGVAELNTLMSTNLDSSYILSGCEDTDGVVTVPANYTGTLTLRDSKIASVNAAGNANIVIKGDVEVENTSGSAITAVGELNISGDGSLTAIAGNVKAGFGIGGMNVSVLKIEGITIKEVSGAYADYVADTTDDKYLKNAPEGGAAIGSGKDGAVITLNDVTIENADGGSKAAGIGARYWTGVTININNSEIKNVEGGASAAGIGGSRVSDSQNESGTTINITNSTITAKGGAYGAGIGSGYDTHCQTEQPLCTINIDGSTINATGGQYAAGVGTGYHNAALAGEIKNSTINAVSGDKLYKDTYTQAQDIGFGVVDPEREGQQTDSKLTVNGTEIKIPNVG